MADPVTEKEPEGEDEIEIEIVEGADTQPGADAGQEGKTEDTVQGGDAEPEPEAEPNKGEKPRNRVTAKERIAQITREKHEQERQRQDAERNARLLAEALEQERAARLELAERVSRMEHGTIQDQVARAEADVEARIAHAKARIKAATEDVINPEALAEATAELTQLNAAKQRLSEFRAQQQARGQQRQQPEREPQQQQTDPNLAYFRTKFINENEWMRTNRRLYGVVQVLDQELVADRFDARTPQYWDELAKRVQPYLMAEGIIEPEAEPEPQPQQRRGATPSRPTVTSPVAGVVRSAPSQGNTPTKVRLTGEQVRIAQRLGVSPQQYAAEMLKIEERERNR